MGVYQQIGGLTNSGPTNKRQTEERQTDGRSVGRVDGQLMLYEQTTDDRHKRWMNTRLTEHQTTNRKISGRQNTDRQTDKQKNILTDN